MNKLDYESNSEKKISLLRNSKDVDQLYKKFKDYTDEEIENIVVKEMPALLKKINEDDSSFRNLCTYGGVFFHLKESFSL